MAVIDAWNFPGADGDFAILTSTGELGHFRSLSTPYTIAIVDYLDAVNDMVLWYSKREDTDADNHAMQIDTANDNLQYTYQASDIFETASSSEATATWCVHALTYDGADNFTLRRIPLSTATQSHSATGASGGSNFDDGQTQEVSIGGIEVGGTVIGELDGRIALVLIIKGTALSQGQLEAFADDPLNYGDTLIETYGAQVYFWDDSGDDIGSNGIGAPSLQGGVTRGSANGPDIPPREEVDPGDNPTISQVGVFGIIYKGEQRVPVFGTLFGTTEPRVTVVATQETTTEYLQEVVTFDDDEIAVSFDLTTPIVGSCFLRVENRTTGPSFGLRAHIGMTLLDDPGPSVIAQRIAPATIQAQSGVAVNYATAHYFYARHCQEVLTYSVSAGALPPNLALATGTISGTVTGGASGQYNATIRATDGSTDFAEQPLQWQITTTAPTEVTSGSWGRRYPS